MKKAKKLLSLLLAATMLFTITAGIDLSAYAAGWADYAQPIEFDTVYTESASTTDFYVNNNYYDSFIFNVPTKGKITLNIESEDDEHYTTNYAVQYYIYKANDVDNYVCSLMGTHGYSSGRNIYYGTFDCELPAGNYYLVAEYDTGYTGGGYKVILAKGSYDFSLSYKPSIATPKLKATVNANGSFKLSWNKVSGADKYELYIKQSNGSYKLMKTTTGTSFTTAVAAYGKKYTYKMRAVKGRAKSSYSSAVSAKNTKKLQTPKLKVAVNKKGSFKLSWNKVAGATSYQLYIKQANGSYKLMKTTSSTSFTTAVAKRGKKYSYKMRAVTSKNSKAKSNYSNVVSAKRK